MKTRFSGATFYIVSILGYLVIATAPAAYADELPDFLYSKGGIIYPHTGDSTQEIFRTPPNVKDFIERGCSSVSCRKTAYLQAGG